MAFRKRNVAAGRPPDNIPLSTSQSQATLKGVKPSTLTSHLVTSTGCSSLDSLLGGHGGLALGSCLFVEENGTTDFSGALTRYYAAEGICQGHVVHVVGVGPNWTRELPGVTTERHDSKRASESSADRMKIAWRYEGLSSTNERVPSERSLPSQTKDAPSSDAVPFCHSFDLSKRITVPQGAQINHIQISQSTRPFQTIITQLEQSLKKSPESIHRLVIPTILSPAVYPPDASRPENFIQFLRSLRSLLRRFPNNLVAMITLPLELYPRTSGLTRWAEILSDGVIELTPFPHLMDASDNPAESDGVRNTNEQPQGLLKVHKLPITSERGEGGAGAGNSIGEDLAFTVSRRKFVIKPFSLPPLEGDQEARKEGGKLTAKDIEF